MSLRPSDRQLLLEPSFQFLPLPKPNSNIDTTIRLGAITSKRELFRQFSLQLEIAPLEPNWDTLFDLLCDLSWRHDRPLNLFHQTIPFGPGRKSRTVYLRLLGDVASSWREVSQPLVTIAFAAALQPNA